MRFSEHELTAALTGAAKSVLAARKRPRKGSRTSGADIDAEWDSLDRYERFKLLDALGGQILPVLIALPDVSVAPGTRPSYSAAQLSETIASQVDDDLGRLRRAVVIKARTALVQTALANLPPRLDPDALITPEG